MTSAEVEWAHAYDAYRRLAASPDKLEKLLRSARNSFASRGEIPEWCGVDFLRGWAFFLVQPDEHFGGHPLEQERSAVLGALREHPDATCDDRPPAVKTAPLAPDDAGSSFPRVFSSAPRMHKQPDFLAKKQARLWEPHVAPINTFVEQIAAERDATVPYVDPDSGGILARVLFVLESPAGPAALGSGMLSADNNDATAQNIWFAYDASGMPRTLGLHWNAVPWYVGTDTKNKTVTAAHEAQGRACLLTLLDLAPHVRVVVAFGKPASRCVAHADQALRTRGIQVISSIHPGPQNYASRPWAKDEVQAAFREALRLSDTHAGS